MKDLNLELLKYEFSLARFITGIIYPSKFEPGSDKYVIGRVHKYEWAPALAKYQQLVLLAPRDHLKSFVVTEARSIHAAVYRPGIRIYIVSKTDRQVIDRIENIKRIIESADQLKWLRPKDPDDWSKMSIKCSNGSSIRGAGFFSAHRGKHPAILVLDDPVEEEVIYSPDLNQKYIERFLQTIYPMAEKNTQVVVVGTRQCEGDLYDTLKPPDWKVLEYRAIVDEAKKKTLFPEKWDWDSLMKRKETIINNPKGGGQRIWLKEYLNDVRAIKGSIVKYEDFRFWYRPGEELPKTGRWSNPQLWAPIPPKIEIFQGWDLAVSKKPTADYVACVTIGIGVDPDTKSKNIYVLGVFRKRLNFPERLSAIRTQAEIIDGVRQIGIEDNAFQDDTVQMAIRDNILPVVGIRTSQNKYARLEFCATYFVNHKVFVRPEHQEFMDEIVSFPTGEHDDMFDAFDIAIEVSRIRRKITVIADQSMTTDVGDRASIKALAQAYNLPPESIQEIIPKKLYKIADYEVELNDRGIIRRGVVWLLGKTIPEALLTIKERNAGVRESNIALDGVRR